MQAAEGRQQHREAAEKQEPQEASMYEAPYKAFRRSQTVRYQSQWYRHRQLHS